MTNVEYRKQQDMNLQIDINCDMGEGGANDEALLEYVTSANIACGVHAGSAELMRRTMSLAAARGVGIGAHPGLADTESMGRCETVLTPPDAYDLVWSQVMLMAVVAREMGLTMRHVKPHGTLYNQAARDPALAEAVANAVRTVDPKLILFALAGSELARAGLAAGLRVAREAFADRRYRADGALVPRTQAGAVIDDPVQAAQQALRLAREHKLTAIDGTELTIHADTICIHGDNPRAIEIARRIREMFFLEGITVGRLI
jgi:UPF0271 protein